MTVHRTFAALVLSILSWTSLAFAGNADRAYFCEAEAAGGLSLDANKWRGQVFDLQEKFILKLNYVTTSYRDKWDDKTFEKRTETVQEYKTLIRPQGQDSATSCEAYSAVNSLVGEDNILICSLANFELRVNLDSRRFLEVSFGKFLDKDSKNGKQPDTPYIMGGGCTRID